MPEKPQRMSKRTVLAIGLSAAGLLGLTVLFLFDPAGSPIYPVCLFHKFTGLNCPGCGSLRALHHLTHGEFAPAFHSNPLLIVALGLLPLTLIQGQPGHRDSRFGVAILARPAIVGAICAIVILFGVLRNVPAPAFAWMSP